MDNEFRTTKKQDIDKIWDDKNFELWFHKPPSLRPSSRTNLDASNDPTTILLVVTLLLYMAFLPHLELLLHHHKQRL